MRYSLLILFCFFLLAAKAQEIPLKTLVKEREKTIQKATDTTQWTSKSGGLINANLTQGSLSNWAAGGDNFSLAINSYFNFFRFYRNGKKTWDNNLDINLGFVQSSSLGSRKNDDRLELVSKSGYEISNKLFLSGLFNFRSQFFDGYNYGPNNTKTFSSTILSPAYVFMSAGLDYRPSPQLSIFFSSLTSRWIIVLNKTLSEQGAYGVGEGERVVNAFGALASINYSREMVTNITYKGRLDVFSNYRYRPGNIDWFVTNNISFKINKYFSANYNLDMIYDDDIRIFGPEKKSPALQLKSILGIGFRTQLKEKRK